MSGICGIKHFDGQSASREMLAPVLRELERRGPDGTHHYRDGSLILGQTAHDTTPEAQGETLPFTHPGGCTIIADARLDYREDLIERLGLGDRAGSMGDGELILQAYLAWGTQCLDKLEGDFAFAIHDLREGELFCGRDIAGMRPFIYHHVPGSLFAFASEARALVLHPAIARRVNEARLADFFEELETADLTSTFYETVHRLQPAHGLIVNAERARQWRYYRPEPARILSLASDNDYAAAYRAVFTEAVHQRMRSNGRIGAMLSGGMDSGSIVPVAAHWRQSAGQSPLPTFSGLTDDPQARETQLIHLAANQYAIEPHILNSWDIADLEPGLSAQTFDAHEPFDMHMTMVTAMYASAQRKGLNIVLDGAGGDTTLGSEDMIGWYWHRRAPLQAWREARGEELFWGKRYYPARRAFLRAAARRYAPGWAKRARRAVLAGLRSPTPVPSLISDEFAKRINFAGRRAVSEDTNASARYDEWRMRVDRVLSANIILARERYERVASRFAIEARDPFMDRRLIELCLSMPPDQMQRGGWPKFVARKAMAGIMPEEIRWHRGKDHPGADFIDRWFESLVAMEPGEFEAVSPYADCARFNPDLSANTDIAVEKMRQARYGSWWIRKEAVYAAQRS